MRAFQGTVPRFFRFYVLNKAYNLQNALGRISLTSDLWSDPELNAFMAITAHYLMHDTNNRLQLVTDLLAFRHVVGDHSGDHIRQIFFKVLDDAGISHKVCSIIVLRDVLH